MNKVVARYSDGRVIKGATNDFFPTKDLFHLTVVEDGVDSKTIEVNTKDLKALFFVKDLIGDPKHTEQNKFDPSRHPVGRKIQVVFKDGEVLVGTTTAYQPGRPGLFIVPADSDSNIERCYVVAAATREIGFL